ncbi:hypothetical protein LINPERHAP1_LOCUS21460, partial [Linum perenne]
FCSYQYTSLSYQKNKLCIDHGVQGPQIKHISCSEKLMRRVFMFIKRNMNNCLDNKV